MAAARPRSKRSRWRGRGPRRDRDARPRAAAPTTIGRPAAITATPAVVPGRRRPARWWSRHAPRAVLGRVCIWSGRLRFCVANSTLTARLSMTLPSRPSMATCRSPVAHFHEGEAARLLRHVIQGGSVHDALELLEGVPRPPCPCCSPDFSMGETPSPASGSSLWHQVCGRGCGCGAAASDRDRDRRLDLRSLRLRDRDLLVLAITRLSTLRGRRRLSNLKLAAGWACKLQRQATTAAKLSQLETFQLRGSRARLWLCRVRG